MALFLYFAAGLLPDVDEPFSPSLPNFYSWLVAIVIQLALSRLPKDVSASLSNPYECAILACEVLFVVLLISNTVLFLFIQHSQRSVDALLYSQMNSVEGQSGYNTFQNKTSSTQIQQRGDAQSTGWYDYFIGFRALFPYFW